MFTAGTHGGRQPRLVYTYQALTVQMAITLSHYDSLLKAGPRQLIVWLLYTHQGCIAHIAATEGFKPPNPPSHVV